MTQVLADATPMGPGDVEPVAGIQGRTPLQLAWMRFRRDRVAMASLAFIVLIAIVAIPAVGNFLVDLLGHPPGEQFRETGLSPEGIPVGPNGEFWLGTDGLGRDILARIIIGTQISVLVGLMATGASLIIGVVVGLFAGYFGGKVDTVLSRLMDIVLSFPSLLFAIALIAALESNSVWIIIFVIAFFGWVTIARIVRGQVLSVREKEFIEAARSLGASDLRIVFTDVLPNLVAPIIVYTTLVIPQNILTEAALSFLGLGVAPPTPTWGNMLSDSIQYYSVAWWFWLFPGLALLFTVLSFNLMGDGLRDALDPRAQRTMAK